jgi:Cu2+-exporting ATPase
MSVEMSDQVSSPMTAPMSARTSPPIVAAGGDLPVRRTTAASPAIAETSLRLGGLRCAVCATTIQEALQAVDGVREASVNAAAEAASVRYDAARTDVASLVRAVERAGYLAAPDTAAAARALRRTESRRLLWRVFVAAFCSMQVMMLATPSYVAGPGELAPDLAALLQRGIWMMTLPVLMFSATPFLRGAWRALRRGRVDMDVPVALGIAAAFVGGTAAIFDPAGPLGSTSYLDSLSMFVTFLLGGRWLEMRLRHRAEIALEATCDRLPETVVRLDAAGRPATVRVDALRAGDLIAVPVGQAFAADGIVAEGETEADEALLTGEPAPVAKRAGDAVVAGSLNVCGPVTVRVERVGADTRYEAIVALVRAARARRPALLAQADRWARPFLVGVLVLAALAGAAWSVIDPSRALGVVVAVLIVTCPCALGLAAPSALLAAAGAMGRHGLLPRRLDAIESLAHFDTLLVDKTGTLTEARLGVLRVERIADGDGAAGDGPEAIAVARALAGRSLHPISQALQAWPSSPDGEIATAPALTALREVPGRGLEGMAADGHRWRLGIASWAAARDDDDGGDDPASRLPADDGLTHAILTRDARPLLRVTLAERVRDGAADAVRALQADGVRVHLLSGDRPAAAARLADALGLDGAHGGLAPEDKLAALEAAQARGERVAMLGDGINDAPVLARAGLAIAMGEGAAVARTQADAVLVSNRLADLAAARALARRTLRVVRANLAWSALYNAACVPLALTGHLPPWAAGLGMAASSTLVVANSMRLARG